MQLDVNCPCGSGNKFAVCHGRTTPASLIPASPPVITYAQPVVTRKLDLAAGQNCREGFEGVDIWPGSKHVVNLMRYPWPFDDCSVAELHCSHFLEHIPMIYVDDAGNEVPMGTPNSRDALFRFIDECWRILVPDAWMTIIVPNARSDRGFQDPTHRRFFVPPTFVYFMETWRRDNKLDHYGVESNWAVDCQPASVDAAVQLLPADAQSRRFTCEWNTVFDWVARMQKRMVMPPKAVPQPADVATVPGMMTSTMPLTSPGITD